MMSKLENFWSIISVSLPLLLLVAFFFMPNVVTGLAIIILVVMLGVNIARAIHRNRLAYIRAEITREKLNRSIAIEILVFFLAICLAGIVSRYAGTWAGAFAESRWSGTGVIAGLMVGILVGVSIGFGIRRVKAIWKRV
jgi:hypothetical protein